MLRLKEVYQTWSCMLCLITGSEILKPIMCLIYFHICVLNFQFFTIRYYAKVFFDKGNIYDSVNVRLLRMNFFQRRKIFNKWSISVVYDLQKIHKNWIKSSKNSEKWNQIEKNIFGKTMKVCFLFLDILVIQVCFRFISYIDMLISF